MATGVLPLALSWTIGCRLSASSDRESSLSAASEFLSDVRYEHRNQTKSGGYPRAFLIARIYTPDSSESRWQGPSGLGSCSFNLGFILEQ